MTEKEWLSAADPQPMLEFLRDKVSERKLRLFACACCRRVWNLITEKTSRSAVEIAERYADGQATGSEQTKAEGEVDAAYSAADAAAFSAVALEGRPAEGAAIAARSAVAAAQEGSEWGDADDAPASEGQAQTDYLRDVVGPTLFRSLTIKRKWRTSNVVAIARGIYDDRAFGHLPILADALEDAGCTDAAILEHLRGPGPHVRGCWCLDAILGKK